MATKDFWLDWKNPNENREIDSKRLKETPNLETGDWWDSPDDIKEAGKKK